MFVCPCHYCIIFYCHRNRLPMFSVSFLVSSVIGHILVYGMENVFLYCNFSIKYVVFKFWLEYSN